MTWNGKPVNISEIKMMAGAALTLLDAATVPQSGEEAAPETEPGQAAPGNGVGDWSLKTHWKTRMRVALADHGDSVSDLTYIIEQENSKSVITRLEKRIAELSA